MFRRSNLILNYNAGALVTMTNIYNWLNVKRFPLLVAALIGNTTLLVALSMHIFYRLAVIDCEPNLWWSTRAAHEPYIYLLAGSIFVEILVLFALLRMKSVYILIFVVGLTLSAVTQIFDPIDEGGHFSIIQVIAEQYRWPSLYDFNSSGVGAIYQYTYPRSPFIEPRSIQGYNLCTRMYEAFQPPLYYFAAAPVFAIIPGNLIHKLHGVRLLGVIMLLVAVFFTHQTIALTTKQGRTEESGSIHNLCLVAILLMIYGSVPVLWRVSTVGNSPMALMMCAAFCFALCRIVMRETYNRNDAITLGALAGLCLLSQYTCAVIIVVGLAVFVWKKKYKLAFVYCLTSFLVLSPWLSSNLIMYGSLTGAKLAKELQLATGFQPGPFSFSLAIIYFRDIFTLYLLVAPYPLSLIPPAPSWAWFFGGLIFLACVVGAGYCFTRRVFNVNQSCKSNVDVLICVSSLTFWSTIGLIIVMSLVENMVGNLICIRYYFPAYPFLVIVLYFVLVKLPKILRTPLALALLGFIAFSWSSDITSHLVASDLPAKILSQKNRIVSLDIAPDGDAKVWPIYKGTITQTFVADYDNLYGINFLIRTLSSEQITPYTFRLMDEGKRVLREVNLEVSRIKDSAYYEVSFEPLKDSANKKLSFSVEPTAEPVKTPLWLSLSKTDAYCQGEALINAVTSGRDVVFELVCHYNPWTEASPPAGFKGRPVPKRLLMDDPLQPLGLSQDKFALFSGRTKS